MCHLSRRTFSRNDPIVSALLYLNFSQNRPGCLLEIPCFNPSAPFPPKAGGRRELGYTYDHFLASGFFGEITCPEWRCIIGRSSTEKEVKNPAKEVS